MYVCMYVCTGKLWYLLTFYIHTLSPYCRFRVFVCAARPAMQSMAHGTTRNLCRAADWLAGATTTE